MGTDIHGVFQRRNPSTSVWEDIESAYDHSRDYQLFAVLAGVRNGVGFAGCKIGDAVEPISEPRGLPPDFETRGGDTHGASGATDEDGMLTDGVWMGDHSYSWLTGAEMLAWWRSAPATRHSGVITREEFDAWTPDTEPESYGGAVWGQGIVTAETAADRAALGDKWTYTRVDWPVSLRESLGYFFEEVERLSGDGDVRFVFGFDS